MKKIVKLTEKDLSNLIKRVIKEQNPLGDVEPAQQTLKQCKSIMGNSPVLKLGNNSEIHIDQRLAKPSYQVFKDGRPFCIITMEY